MNFSDKLALMAKKWRSVINRRRRRSVLSVENDDTTKLALKGHFAVYTADERRFIVPLVYLKNEIFRKLLELSEEEFGLSSNRPITLPCDAFWLEYLMTLTGEDHTEIRQKLCLSFLKQFRFGQLVRAS